MRLSFGAPKDPFRVQMWWPSVVTFANTDPAILLDVKGEWRSRIFLEGFPQWKIKEVRF